MNAADFKTVKDCREAEKERKRKALELMIK